MNPGTAVHIIFLFGNSPRGHVSHSNLAAVYITLEAKRFETFKVDRAVAILGAFA